MSKNIQAIILAAGKSTRFNTGRTKLAETLCGQAMILFPTKLLQSLHIPTIVVVGHQQEIIKNIILAEHGETVEFVVQEEQKGTGHALQQTKDWWKHDHILVLNGDVPLVTAETITSLYDEHIKNNSAISFVTSCNPDPTGKAYGKVVKTENLIEIVEAKDFTGNPHDHCCVNAGIYLINKDFLQNYIATLNTNNASKEFYITDLIKIASQNNCGVSTTIAPFDTIRGINTVQELWAAEQIKRSELISKWMAAGVRFHAAQNVHIDVDVTIGAGSYIGNGVHIINDSHVGEHCIIECFSIISNTRIGNHTTIRAHSVVYDSTIGDQCSVGPFAHIEKDSRLEAHAIIGNFVHVKKSTLGSHAKAKHLAYLGDSNIGERVNIGAGTITCNYDGVNKHTTTIEDNCFIGSNNTLVAPVTIGKNSYTAAGSVITNNVPQGALAIGRARQVNKEGYAHALHEKLSHAQTPDVPFIAALKTTDPSSFTEGT